MSLIAASCSVAFVAGVWCVLMGAPRRRNTRWAQLAPYVYVPSASDNPIPVRTAQPVVAWAWGSDAQVGALLRTAGAPTTVTGFRMRQLVAAGLATALTAAWGVARYVTHPGSPRLPIMAIVIAAPFMAGWWVRAKLQGQVRTRAQHMNTQLPTALDLLAFAISSGESLPASLERVSLIMRGALSDATRIALVSMSTGESMSVALNGIARSTTSSAVARAVRAIDVAVERGTPLAAVLRAQAGDARAHHLREMLVLAGKKETAMMIPVVFLVLPMIVAVAIYPGLVQLQVW